MITCIKWRRLSEDRKTLHIQFVTKLLNDMKDSRITTFTDGSSLINPGSAGVGTVIFRAGVKEPSIKLAIKLKLFLQTPSIIMEK